MAITIVSEKGLEKAGFVIFAESNNWTGCEVIKAAPGAGKAIVLTRFQLNAAILMGAFTLGAGETAGSVTTELIGPISINIHLPYVFDFSDGGLQLPENESLTGDESVPFPRYVMVEGHIVDV